MKSTSISTNAPKRLLTRGANSPKFEIGDFVYSFLNPSESRQIAAISVAKYSGGLPKYQLTLCDETGKPKRSGWLNERSLSRVKNNIILF